MIEALGQTCQEPYLFLAVGYPLPYNRKRERVTASGLDLIAIHEEAEAYWSLKLVSDMLPSTLCACTCLLT
jgi:hypothetical protein